MSDTSTSRAVLTLSCPPKSLSATDAPLRLSSVMSVTALRLVWPLTVSVAAANWLKAAPVATLRSAAAWALPTLTVPRLMSLAAVRLMAPLVLACAMLRRVLSPYWLPDDVASR